MDIQIVRKQPVVPMITNKTNSVTLLFEKSHLLTQYKKIPIVSMYDEEGMYLPVSLKLTQIQSKVPSTLLSRWINANCSEKLLTLRDVCQSEEWIVNGINKGWMFIKKDHMLYGLHKISVVEHTVSGCDNHTVVQIDDSVGMQSVLKIATELNLEVFCSFDHKSGNMSSIKLTGVI